MIDLFRPFVAPEAMHALENILKYDADGRMYIGQGTTVDEFEKALHAEFGTDVEPLTVNSGTSGLDLAMHMIGIKPRDEVITTPITCTATNSPIVNRGAIPVWADVNPLTGLIDPRDVASKITKKTKAIVGVNWGGTMPDYEALKSFGLPVIEDAAHGPYYTFMERGTYVVWSFQAIKFLTTIDGGAIITPDQERARLLRWYGLDRRSSKNFRCEQNIHEVGYKYHMNNVNAAIGLANLPYLDRLIQKHQEHAKYYSRAITPDRFVLYVPHFYAFDPYWIYTLLVDDVALFTEYMKERGIEVSPVHARNDTHDGFHFPNGDLPGVDYFNRHQVSIPVGWWLSDKDVEHVANVVNSYSH